MSGSARSNAALLKQREEKNPLLGLGCSYSPYPVRLWIQGMKNYYVDFYRFASKHVHFIHFKARSRLPNEVVAKVEDNLRDQVLKANEEIDEAIVQAETLMKAHGITLSVTDTPNCSPPLCHTAEIISPLTNRYIQLIEKLITCCARWTRCFRRKSSRWRNPTTANGSTKIKGNCAAGVDEAFGPAPAPDRVLATFMRAIEFEQLQHRQTSLVLNLVLRHDQPPVRVGPSSQRSGSLRELPPVVAEHSCRSGT